MKVGDTRKRNGIEYTIYKIDNKNRCFAEDEFKTDIWRFANLKEVK
jgi:hypothetical protein